MNVQFSGFLSPNTQLMNTAGWVINLQQLHHTPEIAGLSFHLRKENRTLGCIQTWCPSSAWAVPRSCGPFRLLALYTHRLTNLISPSTISTLLPCWQLEQKIMDKILGHSQIGCRLVLQSQIWCLSTSLGPCTCTWALCPNFARCTLKKSRVHTGAHQAQYPGTVWTHLSDTWSQGSCS